MSHPVGFRLPAYRALMKALGESDATVEWIEVGVREIERVNRDQGGEGIKALADKHGVTVNPIDSGYLRNRVTKLQILAVHQQAEAFFREFHRTHPRQIAQNRREEEDALTATLRVFGVNFSEDERLEVELFQYYRQARNIISHNPASDSPAGHQRLCSQIRDRLFASPYSKLDAPNLLSKLQFDDFILFTRSLKRLAANLCIATAPNDDHYVSYIRQQDDILKKLKAFDNNSPRAEAFLVTFLRTEYSISVSLATTIAQRVLDSAR